MKKNRTRTRRIGSVFLALWLCIALMPMGVLADDLPAAGIEEGGQDQALVLEEDVESVPAESYEDASAGGEASIEEENLGEDPYDPTVPPETARSFTLDKIKVKFSEPVVTTVPTELKNAGVGRTWIKAGASKMTVNWNLAKQSNYPAGSGLIILRAGGPNKTYSEIDRVSLWTQDQVPVWDPVTSYEDKTAKTKNTPYAYVVVAYETKDGYTYVSHCSDWSAGQTTKSKLKSVYKAAINKKSAELQYKGSVKLTLKYDEPKKTYEAKNFRWYSDDTSVAKVSSSGKVTAAGEGSTTVRGRLASGNEVKCKIKVVGAFKPGTPKLKVDIANTSSVTLVWNSVKNASYYNVYKSNDGLHWDSTPKTTKETKYKYTGLSEGHRYTFYVTAVNKNHGYEKEGSNSNVVNQKAVIKRRPTTVSGWPTSKTLTTGTTFSVSLKIGSPDGRKASLQMSSGSKWVTQKTQTLPSGSGKSTVKITFPNDWGKSATSKWRLVIPKSNTSDEYTTKTLTIKSGRKYQNPSGYIQISNSISKHGYSHYVSKVLINNNSTRSDCVEALIKTANKYKGDAYVNGRSGSPGSGIDASGLVIQACYGGGIDLWPISPSTRKSNAVPSIMDSKLKKITYKDNPSDPTDHPGVFRGDLIFFQTSKGTIGHVAIYLGWDKIIHADPVTGKVGSSTISKLTDEDGKYKYKVHAVRRIYD